MATVTFDTLKFAKTLKKAGVPEAQAEAISIAVRDSHEAAELATKADLQEYESAVRNDLEKLETNLRHEISDLRKEMVSLEQRMDAKLEKLALQITVRLGSIVIAVGALPTLLKLLHVV